MQIYKFGGGVLRDSDGILRMVEIIRSWMTEDEDNDIVIVVSAFGKMTNAFEKLCQTWISKGEIFGPYNLIKAFHHDLISKLRIETDQSEDLLYPVFKDLDKLLASLSPRDENEAYDQIVGFGERLSSVIVSACLAQNGIGNMLIDAHDFIITDSSFRNAKINWEETQNRARVGLFGNTGEEDQNDEPAKRIWLTQGFIGSDLEGRHTTLGREGSDFSAAILAFVLNAGKVVIWKDVPGVMTADPVEIPAAVKLDQISYLEAIELSYFGAKVLHPNTIKPLQNKSIPLYIKSIFSPGEAGTLVIDDPYIQDEKPVIIMKSQQVLISIQPRDFSFIMEDAWSRIFSVLAKHNIKVNLFQHGAVSLSICIDYNEDSLNRLIGDLIPYFKVLYNTGMELLTIRHYSADVICEFTSGRKIYVQQQSRRTARFVLS